jgi:anti-sigma regulatory factor (Ser/Thr protein kinase)
MRGSESWSGQVALRAEPQSAAAARDFVGGALTDHDLLTLVDDVKLVASELATNAIVHAGGPFTVLLRADAGTLVLTVRDGSSRAPLHLAAQVMDTRGRGLSIVQSLSDHWGVNIGNGHSKSVWASFNIAGDQSPITW